MIESFTVVHLMVVVLLASLMLQLLLSASSDLIAVCMFLGRVLTAAYQGANMVYCKVNGHNSDMFQCVCFWSTGNTMTSVSVFVEMRT